ncbi:MAG: hypothetical protein IPP91_11155 [Betaproteobacteria bacterium]|nr:hypothetical protein [Betaproteobacteria bacterium]
MTDQNTTPTPRPAPPADLLPVLVKVVDIDISFGQMVTLLVKLTLAAIPAALLIGAIAFAVALFLGALGMALK